MHHTSDELPCPWCDKPSGIEADRDSLDRVLRCIECSRAVGVEYDECYDPETGEEFGFFYLVGGGAEAIEYSPPAGTHVEDAIANAIRLSAVRGKPVSFTFNDAAATVTGGSNPDEVMASIKEQWAALHGKPPAGWTERWARRNTC